MENSKVDLPQCNVVVRKLTFEEMSRLMISPLYVSHKCGRCQEFAYSSPKCLVCSKFYHYNCAKLRKTCCGNNIVPNIQNHTDSVNCPKCKNIVDYGPQCSVCFSKYHIDCITLFDECCELNICAPPQGRMCGKCETLVSFGPKCPVCSKMYHVECIKTRVFCCGVKFVSDNDCNYKCVKCKRRVGLGSPMCLFCGKIYHRYCLSHKNNTCCGKEVSFEVYLIPAFKYVVYYYNKFQKRKAQLKKFEETVVTHTHTLRSMVRDSDTFERNKKKNSSCQTVAVDTIAIVDVKSELEDKEVDICTSPPPPQLERETSSTPEPSSSVYRSDSSMEGDDSLRNLFDFLYNAVRKFPPHLQTQVKIDLFKTVTEAEMKLHCNMLQNGMQTYHAK